MRYNLIALSQVATYESKAGQKVHVIQGPKHYVTLAMYRSIQLQSKTALLAWLFHLKRFQAPAFQSYIEFQKNVRHDMGETQMWMSQLGFGQSIKTKPGDLTKHVGHILDFDAHFLCDAQAFHDYQPWVAQTYVQLSSDTTKINTLLHNLSLYESALPYLEDVSNLALEIGTMTYDDYVMGMDMILKNPFDIFLWTSEDADRKILLRILDDHPSSHGTTLGQGQAERIGQGRIFRQLADDTQAHHIVSFRKYTTAQEKILLDIFAAWVQEFGLDHQLELRHGSLLSQCYVGHVLPTTQLPNHIEALWLALHALKSKPITAEALSMAWLKTCASYQARLENPAALLSFLSSQIGFYVDTSFMDLLYAFEGIDRPSWEKLLEDVFCFEDQSMFESVPRHFGMGADQSLRFASLAKRLGQTSLKQISLPQYCSVRGPKTLNQDDPKEKAGLGFDEAVEVAPGHELIKNELPHLKACHLSVYIDGGRRFEHAKNAGQTQLLLMSLLNGSSLQCQKVAQLKGLGVSIKIQNNADFFGFDFIFPSFTLASVTAKIADLIFASDFETSLVDGQKLALLNLETQMSKDSFLRSVELFYQSIFGGHGYGLPRLGRAECVLNINSSLMQEIYKENILQSPRVLWVLNASQTHTNFAKLLEKALPQKEAIQDQKRAMLVPMKAKNRIPIIQENQVESHHAVCIGMRSKSIKHGGEPYLDIMQIYLSGVGGKLMDTLVERLKIVDTIKAYHVQLMRAGVFFLQLKTEEVNNQELFEYIQTIFTSLRAIEPSQKKFDNAKQLAILRRWERLQDPQELSYDRAYKHFANLPWKSFQEIESDWSCVHPAQLTEHISTLLDGDDMGMGIC